MNSEEFIQQILDTVEVQESRLLSWGLADGCLSRDDLVNIIDPILDEAIDSGLTEFFDAGGVIDTLSLRGLVFSTESGSYPGFRSRMGETVRLLFHLRQMFPQHAGKDGWQNARTLVSDFRFLRRPRKFPRREITVSAAISQISESIKSKALKEAISILLEKRGANFALAEFQILASKRILNCLKTRRSSGTIISAGTGSGKTLAFYLPALAKISEHLVGEAGDSNWVKCLALYPRTELLKDQFSEIYREARRLDGLTTISSRKIRIGAFFSATPYNANSLLKYKIDGWRKTPNGFICGYLSCPKISCSGELTWLNEAIHSNQECLVCSECEAKVTNDEVIFTRQSLKRTAPDILFTTTEMVNQRLSDSNFRHLFGLRPQATKPLEMLLLDEVHTYSGLHGAQVAYLLRRWMHLVKAPITFVGLSATLREGKSFFSRLTGIYENFVEEIYPTRNQMEIKGAEYLLAVKGDPVSQTSLLSTTIQTAMLLSRMLDRPNTGKSEGVYGSKIFAFTDDLDVTNRLYHGLQDAEGRNSRGQPDMARHPNGGLAYLRTPIPSKSRDSNGQNWDVPQALEHDLSERKNIGLTSSQDPGVVEGMDVVVATASLEVGFNDPMVGAIIQHKGPRDVASFIQRKGRAGRSQNMRPWTIVILSDYGRDRLTYQAYDTLFDPELTVQAIPLSSRYIQRIQAVYALIDYLCSELSGRLGKGSVWKDLSEPSSEQTRRKVIEERLEQFLMEKNAHELLGEQLQKALRISDEEISSVFWQHPRPLMTAVIPTALRRLKTNWKKGSEPGEDFYIANSPLPEFAPGNLFGELNLPEVRIQLPAPFAGDEPPPPKMMPVLQAMKTFAPGRVSRRFGSRHKNIRHWIAPENIEGSPNISIDEFFGCDPMGAWQFEDGSEVRDIQVFRAYEIRPKLPPPSILDTSNSRLVWQTQILRRHNAEPLAPPGSSMWKGLVESIEAYTHAEQQPIEVRRFSNVSLADIQYRQGDSLQAQFMFTQHNSPVAMGFSLTVDSLRLKIHVPERLWKEDGKFSKQKWRALRAAKFFDAIWKGEETSIVKNPFLRQWLGYIFFAAITQDAVARDVDLKTANAALQSGDASLKLRDVLGIIFQSPAILDEDIDPDHQANLGPDTLRQELEGLLGDDVVLRWLHNTSSVLWNKIDKSWQPWLKERFKSTLAATVFDAINNLCPDIDADGLVVDLNSGPRANEDIGFGEAVTDEIWISETSPGGTGLIEEIVARYAEDPRRFYSLLTAGLQANEYELVDYQLKKILKDLAGTPANQNLIDVVDIFRRADSTKATDEAFAELRHSLTMQNFVIFHSFTSALGSRVIRPGSSLSSDKFLFDAISLWVREEERLKIELEPQTIALLLSKKDEIDKVVTAGGLSLPEDNIETWRFNVIYGMLWSRGAAIRQKTLSLYNPFCEIAPSERLLVVEQLNPDVKKIPVDDPKWKKLSMASLSEDGIATLICPVAERKKLSEALNFFATNPVHSDYLSVFARLDAVRRIDDIFEVDLEIAEARQ